MIGSPSGFKGAVIILLVEYWAMRALPGGNTAEFGGTKAIPSAPAPTLVRRLTAVTSKVPLPSGVRLTSYQPPVVNETIFTLPAPGNPGGTKASDPTDDATPAAVRSMTLLAKRLPGLRCSS